MHRQTQKSVKKFMEDARKSRKKFMNDQGTYLSDFPEDDGLDTTDPKPSRDGYRSDYANEKNSAYWKLKAADLQRLFDLWRRT